MEKFMSYFVNACPSKGIHRLSLHEFWYNSSHYSAIGCSHFLALYGFPPHILEFLQLTQFLYLNSMLAFRTVKLCLLSLSNILSVPSCGWRNKLTRIVANGTFRLTVWFCINSTHMCSLRLLLMQVKSFSKHFGPSRILAKLGQVNYKLELPFLHLPSTRCSTTSHLKPWVS